MPVTENQLQRQLLREKNNTDHVNQVARYWEDYSSFIELAAHDLRAPLRKLGVLTDRLTDKYKLSGDADVDQYTHRIHACIKEMQSLIDSLTELASATAESMHYSSCDVNELVRRLSNEYGPRIKEGSAELVVHDLPLIRADAGQLRIALRELIENSLLFRSAVPLRIEISCERISDSRAKDLELDDALVWQMFTVTDNGIGMDANDTERIFQPLARLHGRSAFGGNGLGLTLVKRIADNHGGLVFAESKPGEGTRVHLILPENVNA